jgi:hypothetical protein
MTRIVLFILAGALCAASGSYAQDKSRPANAADFTGVFELIDFPAAQQPRYLQENPWPAPCQFFGHYPGGYWLHQQQTAPSRRCTSTIPPRKPALPQSVTWKMLKDGFVLIDRTDYKVQEIWKVDHINGPTHLDAINLNRGDLIMQLLDRTGKQLIWIRVLRRVGDAAA